MNGADLLPLLQLMESEHMAHDMRVQLTTVQGHHKEGMEQLCERSRQLAAHKTELARMQQQNITMRDEVGACWDVCVCVFGVFV